MQQRQLRLGDILDDYCPRERRVTNHAVVAMVGHDVKQTRCTTCDAEHEYKHAKVPRQRRKANTPAALYSQVVVRERGVLIASVGFQWCYTVDAVLFVAALAGVLTLPPLPPEGAVDRPGLASLASGIRFLRSAPNVRCQKTTLTTNPRSTSPSPLQLRRSRRWTGTSRVRPMPTKARSIGP